MEQSKRRIFFDKVKRIETIYESESLSGKKEKKYFDKDNNLIIRRIPENNFESFFLFKNNVCIGYMDNILENILNKLK